jgi:tetratricopeptide (TPR) repeat protein
LDLVDPHKYLNQQTNRITNFIAFANKIIRFIDHSILISLKCEGLPSEIRFTPTYYNENGICVYIENRDYFESVPVQSTNNSVFLREILIPSHLKRFRKGLEIYLLRNGSLVSFTRSGQTLDEPINNYNVSDEDLFLLQDPQLSTPQELITKFESFEQEFFARIKLSIVNAVDQNENKRPILKKVITYLNILEKQKKEECDFQQAIELDPKNPDPYLDYAKYLAWEKFEFDLAEKIYQKAIDLDPNQSKAHVMYGQFLEDMRKNKEKSQKEYQKSIELKPDNANAYFELASSFWTISKEYLINHITETERKELTEKAEDFYQKAIELEPNNANFQGFYALFQYWVPQDYNKAITAAKKAIALEPKKLGHYINYIQLLEMIGITTNSLQIKIPEIEQIFQQCQSLISNENVVDYHEHYAFFLQNTKHDFDKAEQHYLKALDFDPGNPNIILTYASFLWNARHDLLGAEKIYEQAIDLITVDNFLYENIQVEFARLLIFLNKTPQALKIIKLTAKNTSDHHLELICWVLEYLHFEDKELQHDALINIKKITLEGVSLKEEDGYNYLKEHFKKSIDDGIHLSKNIEPLFKVLKGEIPFDKFEKNLILK